ncbi:MAG: hypothetical protein ACOYNG_05710 [Terrimicrobiaceae bacterium]
MISNILLVVGAGVLAAALRSCRNLALFSLGNIAMVGTSFLAGWLLGGSVFLGAAFAAMWFVLPWFEILTRVRTLRLPLHRPLEKCPPPPAGRFPAFGDLTDEMESAGYEYVEDVEWNHGGIRQFYRTFHNARKRTSSAICLSEQDGVSFYFVTFTSRGMDGQTYLTWNYPFSYSMRLAPSVLLNKVEGDCDVAGIDSAHGVFLDGLGMGGGQLKPGCAETLRSEIEADLRSQIEHNIACGILKRDGDEMIRYSLRGMFFLWTRFLREFVKLPGRTADQ